MKTTTIMLSVFALLPWPVLALDTARIDKITGNEVLEAIQFRSLDRRLFE